MKLFIRRVIVILLLFNFVTSLIYLFQDNKPHMNYWDCAAGFVQILIILIMIGIVLWGLIVLVMWLWED